MLPLTSLFQRRPALSALLLILVATLPWWLCLRAQLIWFDDLPYILENPSVLTGLSWHNLVTAFTTTRGAMWIPLTWLSFQLDVSLFGIGAVGFHFTNITLHIANTYLLFLVLRRYTQSTGKSLVLALLWSLHPLRVESVAWATERKDVLALFLGLLALLAYHRYATAGRLKFYLLALLAFAASLMAKPMMVTLPIILLLLDFWPLRRPFTTKLLLEKLPFFALSAAISAITILIPASDKILVTGQQVTLSTRLMNATVAYALYLRDTFWFENLSFFYPLRDLAPGQILLSFLLLLAITAAVMWASFRRPDLGRPLLVGWCWFVIGLLPVSGLLQMGSQSRADRFSYFPAIGLLLALVWLAAAALRTRLPTQRWIAPAITAVLLAVLAIQTSYRIVLWHDPGRLYLDGARRSAPNGLLEFMVGKGAQDAGQDALAAQWYLQSIASTPDFPLSHHNLGTLYVKSGQLSEALHEFQVAAALDPMHPEHERASAWTLRQMRERGIDLPDRPGVPTTHREP